MWKIDEYKKKQQQNQKNKFEQLKTNKRFFVQQNQMIS